MKYIIQKDNSTKTAKMPPFYAMHEDGEHTSFTNDQDKALVFTNKKEAQKLADKVQGEVITL